MHPVPPPISTTQPDSFQGVEPPAPAPASVHYLRGSNYLSNPLYSPQTSHSQQHYPGYPPSAQGEPFHQPRQQSQQQNQYAPQQHAFMEQTMGLFHVPQQPSGHHTMTQQHHIMTPYPPESVTPPPRPLSAPGNMFASRPLPNEGIYTNSPLGVNGHALEEPRQYSEGQAISSSAPTTAKRGRGSSGATRTSSTSEKAVKRLQQAQPYKTSGITDTNLAAPDSPSLSSSGRDSRNFNHKRSDQRRREALRTSFNRLLSVIPQTAPSESPPSSLASSAQGLPATSASPPALMMGDDDDDGESGKNGLNRVETMQLTIRYIHSLKEKNSLMDSKIAELQQELARLKQRQLQ
ncbi:hypothetical protein BC830DRAFT_1086636 [Chytriomyces sp. MP71]|nr:hypothetical protein BC830DRAFT_1086636 [Chytriomyces sp. MP71]